MNSSLCEYGIVEGGMMECSPGDTTCIDDDTLGVCHDGIWSLQDCYDRCSEHYGSEYVSAGCDIEVEEPCQCLVLPSGSGGE